MSSLLKIGDGVRYISGPKRMSSATLEQNYSLCRFKAANTFPSIIDQSRAFLIINEQIHEVVYKTVTNCPKSTSDVLILKH